MKEKTPSSEIYGLNREYFHFLVEQTFDANGLSWPSAEQIDDAIEQTNGLAKKVLEASFRLTSLKKIAEECNLTTLRVQELYSQGLRQVVLLLERQAENREASINENN